MRISIGSFTLPAAALGPDNPLPPLGGPSLVTVPSDLSAADPVMARNLAYGRPNTLLPYTVQDGYSRNLADTEIKTAVVENDLMRAEFLLDYGARLWSLYDKAHKRELLHRNTVLQPGNLALRNAWFAGGVEWNLGTTGHTPLTCAPVHAANVGGKFLRLWEFERMRELVYQLDVWLEGAVLFVNVTITNANEHEVPVYWWSNIAVPERDGTRVLAPAEQAWHLNFDGILNKVPAPDGYTDRFEHAADHFYDIPPGRRPWIAAIDSDGTGLLQTSTENLRGRKLFVWGRSNGGQRWQEWLSPPGHPYLEIQAGLARTQLEHLPMPAKSRWSWLESYSRVAVDPAAAHGLRGDATAAVTAVLPQLPALDPSTVDAPPTEILHTGSGWGALESRLRSRIDAVATAGSAPHAPSAAPGPHDKAAMLAWPDGAAEPGPRSPQWAWRGGLDLPGTPFGDESLGRDQASWVTLLETGTMTAPAPRLSPASYQVSPQWKHLLESASPHNWFTLLHLGVARWHAGEREQAVSAWEQSRAESENPWALRNLAFAAQDAAAAVELLRQAHGMVPGVRAIAVETIQAFLEAGKPAEALTFIDRLVLDLRLHGRVRLLECRAALAAGRLDRAARIVDTGIIVDDLREGEDALDDLWFSYHTQRGTTPLPQLPCLYDFRTGARE